MLSKQYYIQSLIQQCFVLSKSEQKESPILLESKIDQIFSILTQNINESMKEFSNELILKFMELTCQIPEKRKYSLQITNLYFQRFKHPNQFYIRALLVKARLVAQQAHIDNKKGEQMVAVLKQALSYTVKALDIITGGGGTQPKGKDSKATGQDNSKQKYAFLIYNVSTCIYKMIRTMLKTNWQKNFTEIIDRVCKLFDQIDEPDHNWRCRFSLILHQCLYDSDKKPDAFKVLDQLWEKTKNKNCDFQDELFKLRVHLSKQNTALAGAIKKDLQGTNDQKGWKILQILQRMKSGLIPEPQIQKQLMNVVNSISSAVLIGNQTSTNKLSPIIQDRLAETGRVALLYNHINVADSITNFLNKARQLSQKAMVLNQYNKAQLLVLKKGPQIDNKTGMKLNIQQLKVQQIQRRSEALKILQKVSMINKRLGDAELIYEGCILIWNICLPLMTLSQREVFTKTMQASSELLQQIDSNDHSLRIKFHLELAKTYFGNQSTFSKVEEHIHKAMILDSSIPLSKITYKYNPEQQLGLYQRPYDRYIKSLQEKSQLKKHHQERINTELDKVVIDLWNVMGQKSQNTKIDILQKCLGNIVNIEEKQYDMEDAKSRSLVPEEIKEEIIKHKQLNLRLLKKKKLLAAQIAQLAFEWEINEVAENACQFVILDKWQPENALQMILSQVKCYYFLGQLHIDYLIKQNFQIAFTEPIKIEEDQKNKELPEQTREKVQKQKQKIFKYFSKGIQLADLIEQSWLVFNGAIYIWNNFLHIFKNPINDSKLHEDLCQLLKQLFQTMKNNLKDNNKKIVSYDIDTKGQIFANIGLIYARLMENLKQPDEVNKICEALSLTQLSPHTRKLINSIKSRVTTGKSNPSGVQKQPVGKGKDSSNIVENNEVFLFEIVSQLQIIKNSVNKSEIGNLIKKCFESLEIWKPRQNDETDLQLHAELWARLARLALNQDSILMFKYSIKCVQNSLSLSPNNDSQVSPNRLRWYSLAEYTYGESLTKMVNPDTQDVETCQKLLFEALNHAVEAVQKGFKCSLNILVLDAAKQVWNICSRLQESAVNRKNLIKPIYHSLSCLKLLKQKSETDLLLLLSQLLFKSALQNKQFKIGQNVADMLFQLVPKNMQKSLWEAKMIFMSKQGKNELQAISNMKETDVSLQAKLWIKLARVSTQINKQHAAYNKAIQILRKEGSVEIVQVLIQYAEWQLRINKEAREVIVGNLLLASDYLIDIQYGEQQTQENLEDDKATIFSRSSRGKRSQVSNQQSFKSKMTKTKKQLQKKTVISNKSKGSRMNRTARAANTIKSKNTKSIFIQRQQQANPQSLNCAHYERLFRIHTILANISKSTQQRIRYALDAKHFLIKILEISFRTLNTMDENAAKYTNAMEERKISPEQYVKKYKIPVEIQDWIKLTLSKQFVEKVKTLEDYNFMGIFMFQKPQLTLSYIQQLIQTFERYGFELHTIPIYFFVRFLAKQIINNPWLTQLYDMRFCRTLKRCGFSKQLYESFEFSKLQLSDLQKKTALAKSNSLKYQPNQLASLDTLHQVPNQIPLPNLVKSFSERAYQIWINIGLQLLQMGKISNSKQLLKQSLIHCKLLKDIPMIDKCYLGLCKISMMEGQMVEATNLIINCNKMCRDVKQWQIVYEIMFEVLITVNKFYQLRKFTESVLDVVSKFLQDIKKERKPQVITHEHEYLELQHLLATCKLSNIELCIQQYLVDKKPDESHLLLIAINGIQGQCINESTSMLYSQYERICNTFSKILSNLEQGTIEPQHPQLGISINNKILNILLRMQAQIMNSGRYILIGISEKYFKKHNPMINIQHKLRLCISRSYNVEGLLKKANNIQEIKKKMDRISLLQQDSKQQRVSQSQNYEPLKRYLEKLNVKIQKDLVPIEKKLDSFEASISLLRNLQNKISAGSYMEIQLGMLLMSAQRKRASIKEELSEVWAELPNTQSYEQRFDANQSLQRSQDFIEVYQNRCGDYLKNPNAFSISRRIYVQMIQNRGRMVPEKTFEYIVKSQHYGYLEKLKNNINLWLQDNHTFISYQRLLRKIQTPSQQIIDQINKMHLFQSLIKFPTYEQTLQILPNNSALITLSFSVNKSEMYFGMMTKINSSEVGKPPDIQVSVRKIDIAQNIRYQYQEIQKDFNSIKSTLSKIPINQEEKYKVLVQQQQLKCQETFKKFEKLQMWWLTEVQNFINTPKIDNKNKPQQNDPKKQTKQPPKATKKAGKDDLSAYESPLTASPCGIQSLTFLLDTQLYNLPFEGLSKLQVVPSVSRDCSLLFLSRKLQSLNYKPELNNSDGFGLQKCKYVCYDFKDSQKNAQNTFLQISKQVPSIKFSGVSTSKRIPSFGEYQQIFSQTNILHVFGSLSFINTLKFQSIISNLPISKVRLLLINDNINTHKATVNKFEPIQNGQTHFIHQQDIDTIHIMNLMNISCAKTRWSIDVDQNKKIIKQIYNEAAKNIYFAAGIRKALSKTQTILQKLQFFYNGPAVIKI